MTTTATHLRTCALHWTDLRDALGAPAVHNGFGIGLRGHLAALDDFGAELDLAFALRDRQLERADMSTDALGERPVPVRLHILDTMRLVEAALTDCADQTAAEIQRQPMAFAPRSWPAADRTRRDTLARADIADPRRWRWTGRRRPVPYTALWLLARVEGRGGPFSPLTDRQRERIARVASDSADRTERALDIAAQRRTLERLHECGGKIDIHGGEGRQPLAHCVKCGRIWTEGGMVAA
jgi:hypothetical protein